MKLNSLVQALLIQGACAFNVPRSEVGAENVMRAEAAGGSGPYKAGWTSDATAKNFTLYAPTSPPSTLQLPVIVWGNGACSFNGLDFEGFLTEVASHGIFIVAVGAPHGPQNPNGINDTQVPDPSVLKGALDWVTKAAGTGKYANVNASRIAAAGQSCGGIQAYTQAHDPRVSFIGIFNSGEINETRTTLASLITKPVFYFLGGSTDIAYENGERDYSILPAGVPKWKGNLPVGHGGTYWDTNGGKFGTAASHWAQWLLRGDTTAATYFTGTGAGTAAADGWSTVSKDLDELVLTPL